MRRGTGCRRTTTSSCCTSRGSELAAAHGALAGLLGRGRRGPEASIDALSAEAVAGLLDRAPQRLGRPATTEQRTGRVEREVVAATEDASC